MEQIRVENGVNIHRCEQGCKQGPKWWEEMAPDCVRGESEGSREQEIQKAQCVPGNGRIAGRQRALHNGDNSWQERRITGWPECHQARSEVSVARQSGSENC